MHAAEQGTEVGKVDKSVPCSEAEVEDWRKSCCIASCVLRPASAFASATPHQSLPVASPPVPAVPAQRCVSLRVVARRACPAVSPGVR